MNTVEPIRSLKKLEDMKKFLLGSNVRDYALFIFAINNALRISDILKFKWVDVLDADQKFKRQIYLREKKTGKEKRFILNKNAIEALQRLLDAQKTISLENYIFSSRQGENKPVTSVRAWQIIKGAAMAVGIKEEIGCHSTRKTWGYHAWKNGIQLPVIMEMLNHTSLSTTKRYLGITQDTINDAIEKLNL